MDIWDRYFGKFVLRQDSCCFFVWDLRQLGQGFYAVSLAEEI